jgi:hypothetical protein
MGLKKNLSNGRFVFTDKSGETFGQLLVVKPTGKKYRDGSQIYECLCSCGKVVNVSSGRLTESGTKSCGCVLNGKLRNGMYRIQEGLASMHSLMCSYRFDAKSRGFSFDLGDDDFRSITKRNCIYCGCEPSAIHGRSRPNGHYVFNGIDRLDSSKGYSIENCVPCCKSCNIAKHTMSYDEFKAWVSKVYFNMHKESI